MLGLTLLVFLVPKKTTNLSFPKKGGYSSWVLMGRQTLSSLPNRLGTRERWRRWCSRTRDVMFWYIVNRGLIKNLCSVLMYVLVSTGLSLQMVRLIYPWVINRGRREGVLDEKDILPCLFKMICGSNFHPDFKSSKLDSKIRLWSFFPP